MKPMMDSEQRMTIAAQLAALRRAEYENAMVGNMLDMFDNAPDAYHDMTPTEAPSKPKLLNVFQAIAVFAVAFLVIGLAVLCS